MVVQPSWNSGLLPPLMYPGSKILRAVYLSNHSALSNLEYDYVGKGGQPPQKIPTLLNPSTVLGAYPASTDIDVIFEEY